MATFVYFQHPKKQDIKRVKIGFHWFGGLIPLFNGTGNFKVLLRMMFTLKPWANYRFVVKNVIDNGYKYKSIEGGKPIEAIEHKLGFSLPIY